MRAMGCGSQSMATVVRVYIVRMERCNRLDSPKGFWLSLNQLPSSSPADVLTQQRASRPPLRHRNSLFARHLQRDRARLRERLAVISLLRQLRVSVRQ